VPSGTLPRAFNPTSISLLSTIGRRDMALLCPQNPLRAGQKPPKSKRRRRAFYDKSSGSYRWRKNRDENWDNLHN